MADREGYQAQLAAYEDRHGGRHLSDEESQRLGAQPHPEARRLIHEAAVADEYFARDEIDELERIHYRRVDGTSA